MDKLPDAVVVEILSRLDDSADVARCRVAWKTFNTVSPNLRSINLQWSLRRIEARSRVPNSSSSPQSTFPLKTVFLNLISNVRVLESVQISAKKQYRTASQADREDNGDDLYLTDGRFVKEWLPGVSGTLKSLSISDYSIQSFRRRPSEALSLVSDYCQNLLELELKYTRLSVDNLRPMPMLTRLTLKCIELDDNDISQVNKCFPNLQVLNFNCVHGPKLPKIHLLNLTTCHWTVVGPPSSVTLIAPNLIKLKLECIWSSALYVEAPKLSHFELSIDRIAGEFTIKNFENLKTLWLDATNIRSLLIKFPLTETVEDLTLDTRITDRREVGDLKFTLKDFGAFPSMTSLCFSSRAWSEFEVWYGSCDEIKGLKTFRGYLLMDDPSSTFSLVACVLDQCVNLVDVFLLIRGDVAAHVSKRFITRCIARWPKLKWRWGMWEPGWENSWQTDNIPISKSSKKCSRKAQISYLKEQRN